MNDRLDRPISIGDYVFGFAAGSGCVYTYFGKVVGFTPKMMKIASYNWARTIGLTNIKSNSCIILPNDFDSPTFAEFKEDVAAFGA